MKKIELVLLFCFTCFLTALSSLAAEPDYVNDTPLESMLSHGTIYEGGILRSVISLAIVIGLIYFTAWLYKKLNKFNTQKFNVNKTNSNINKFNVVSSQTLGQNKALYVVEINNQYLVIGATQNNISLLKEFNKCDIEILNKDEHTDKKDTWVNDIASKYENIEDKNAKGN